MLLVRVLRKEEHEGTRISRQLIYLAQIFPFSPIFLNSQTREFRSKLTFAAISVIIFLRNHCHYLGKIDFGVIPLYMILLLNCFCNKIERNQHKPIHYLPMHRLYSNR